MDGLMSEVWPSLNKRQNNDNLRLVNFVPSQVSSVTDLKKITYFYFKFSKVKNILLLRDTTFIK